MHPAQIQAPWATIIQIVPGLTLAIATRLAALAESMKTAHLPRVVIAGKSQAATKQVVQLPRVVIEGRSSRALAKAYAIKPASRRS